ncbi:hypothetical protein K4K58_008552 [Colletotrichum sp. SAR11_239]|nr:hypothetical protein K4K58_008552 [Colletotrichum sp. SAR11_239]
MNVRVSEGPYSQLTADILKQSIKLGEVVLDIQPKASSIDPEGQEWKERLRKWHGLFEDMQRGILQLRAAAAAQVGQGFGNTTTSSPSDLNGINLQSLMIMRQNKLLMMETAMKNAEDNVRRITRQNQATQVKMIQLAHQMRQLDHSKAKLEDTKKVLFSATDVLCQIKSGFNTMKKNFDYFAAYIDDRITYGTGAQLIGSMEAAQGRVSDGDMLCCQIQARAIVDMVL